MKKFYLIAASAMLALGMQAEDLVFYNGDTALANDATATWNEVTEEVPGRRYIIKPDFYIMSEAGGKADITMDGPTEVSFQMCCGGLCMNSVDGKIEKKDVALAAGTKVPLEFEASFRCAENEIPKDIEFTCTAVKAYNTSSATLKIVLNTESGSVTKITSDDVVKYVGNALHFNVDGTAAVAVYDLAGNCVMGCDVKGTAAVSTAELPAGVYVYTVNGAASKAGKILVK